MSYSYTNMFFATEDIEGQKLSGMLNDGWELVALAPYEMAPGNNSTCVIKYLATLRREKPSSDETLKPPHVGKVSDFK